MAQPNRMNFRKCSKGGGGGSFSIQKFILHILDLFKGLFFGRFPKTMQYNFTKMRRLKAVWNVSEIHLIWYRQPSLIFLIGPSVESVSYILHSIAKEKMPGKKCRWRRGGMSLFRSLMANNLNCFHFLSHPSFERNGLVIICSG